MDKILGAICNIIEPLNVVVLLCTFNTTNGLPALPSVALGRAEAPLSHI